MPPWWSWTWQEGRPCHVLHCTMTISLSFCSVRANDRDWERILKMTECMYGMVDGWGEHCDAPCYLFCFGRHFPNNTHPRRTQRHMANSASDPKWRMGCVVVESREYNANSKETITSAAAATTTTCPARTTKTIEASAVVQVPAASVQYLLLLWEIRIDDMPFVSGMRFDILLVIFVVVLVRL